MLTFFQIDDKFNKAIEESNTSKATIEEFKEKKINTEEEIQIFKERIQQEEKNLNDREKSVQNKQSKVKKSLERIIQLDIKINAVQDKIKNLEKNKCQATKVYENCKKTIIDLKEQLKQVEEDEKRFLEMQTPSFELDNTKVNFLFLTR